MPRLNTELMDRGSVDPAKLAFGKYYDALMKHENGHAKIDIKSARKINEFFGSLYRPHPNCEEIESKIKTAPKEIRKNENAENTNYDIENNHGETQGATSKLYF